MEKPHFKILINAPREKVYKTMLDEKTYNQWTEAFSPGCHHKNDWSERTKILFLASDKNGVMGEW